MVSVLSTIALWGPSTYYALRLASTLITPSYIKHKNGPTTLAKDCFPKVFEKVDKMRKDILIYVVTDLPYAAAIGTNFGPAAVLLISEELLKDNESMNYICKHELSHINTSDGFVATALATTASAISTYAVPYLHSCLPWWAAPISYCVPHLAGLNTYIVAMFVFENLADRFASRHATPEELIDMERFVKGYIEVNKAMQTKYPKLFALDGNTRFELGDITHSPLTERLEEIRTECRKRNIHTEESSDKQLEKMQKIKEIHQNTYKKFLKLKVD